MPRHFEPMQLIAARNWRQLKPPKAIPERERARFGAPRRVQTYPAFFSFYSLGRTWAFKESSLYSPETGKRSSRKMSEDLVLPKRGFNGRPVVVPLLILGSFGGCDRLQLSSVARRPAAGHRKSGSARLKRVERVQRVGESDRRRSNRSPATTASQNR